ncbi:1787_t:CDS:2, partial [Rhizophagus irregularis]
MDRTHIVALAKNILRYTSTLAMAYQYPGCESMLIIWKRDLFCIEPAIQRIYPSFMWTHISPEVSRKEKGSQDKATTPTTDTTSKQVDSGDQTPVDEDADVILMNELGILGGEEQSSSKTTDQASSSIEATKETSDQATSPIEVVSTTPGNSKNVDDSISKELSSGQIQRPICEKCSEEISIDFQKDTVFLSCKHAVHLDCINDLHKRCPTCTSADDMESFPVEQASSTAQKRSMWNSVRVKENIQDVENEIDKWEWLMLQKKLNLINEKVILVRKNRFNNFNNDNLYDLPELNFESNQNLEDENEDLIYISNLLQCNELNAWTYTMEDGNFLLKILQNHHSNYDVNLKNYLEKVWWKTIVLWSNLATVEVENNIVKNLDIGKKNLPIDEYIGIRTQTLKSTQNLIAEKLMHQDKLNEQWKPKRTRVFTSKESKILKEFKIILDYRKTLDVPSQYRIAREIRDISLNDIGFNQSMVS